MLPSCRYESTSSDDSSSESSDEGSDSSEYHEAREKLPEFTIQHQQTSHAKVSQPQGSNSVPQQTITKIPATVSGSQHSPNPSITVGTTLPDTVPQSPATDTVVQKCASQPPTSGPTLTPPCPVNTSASKETASQSSEKQTQEITCTSSSTESTPEQSSIKPCDTKTTEITKQQQQQHIIQSETTVLSSQSEPKSAADNITNTRASAKQVR